MKSYYAEAARDTIQNIKESFKHLTNMEYLDKLFDSLPYVGAILNHQRQVVFANERLLEILNIDKKEDLLGKRPGEILHCINSNKEIGGCGTSENCSVCGAVNSILTAQGENKVATCECRITGRDKDQMIAYDFKVTTSPFQWNDQTYYMFTLIDISSEKRRRNLEKIFFHDIINKTSSFQGFVDLMKQETNIEKLKQFIDLLEIITFDLNEEIFSQKELSDAESGDLHIDNRLNNSMDILSLSVTQISHHDVARDKTLHFSESSQSIDFMTDGVLLKRILINMLKNALEASQKGSKVTAGCQAENDILKFWVHNQSYINKKDQLKIFQRSFSTKSIGRGLGTYSIKLLGENYLKGKVGFSSDKEKGTEFYILFNLQQS
jgi:signal transduction histidine kinase